jgi:hypothetical protein
LGGERCCVAWIVGARRPREREESEDEEKETEEVGLAICEEEDAWDGREDGTGWQVGPEGRARCPSVRGAADKRCCAAQLRRTAALHAS